MIDRRIFLTLVASVSLLIGCDQSKTEAADPLPSIHVNDSDGTLTFSNWHTEGYNLVGTVVWNGAFKIDSITFTARRNGVVNNKGSMIIPGDELKSGEATQVTALLWEQPSGLDVTIDVNY